METGGLGWECDRWVAEMQDETMMKTTYKNTVSDILAFMLYHSLHRRALQLMILAMVVVTSISTIQEIPHEAAFPVNVMTFIILETIVVGIGLLAIGGISILCLILNKDKAAITEHTVSIDENGLTEETVFNRSEFKWAGIQKLVRSDRHIFVYVSPNAAHVIPRRAFASPTEWDEFFQKMTVFKDGSRQRNH
jgi:hypothetical protein